VLSFRAPLAATIAVAVTLAVSVFAPAVAAATALPDGLYRFDFDGAKQTLDGKPDPTTAASAKIAIRSICADNGCVATAWDTFIGPTWLQPPYEGKLVFRENRDQWVGTRWRMFNCQNTINQGSETLAFQVQADGRFVGVSTMLQSPCAPIVLPFTATRIGDIPADVVVADPATA
jgi:hypothetical protein